MKTFKYIKIYLRIFKNCLMGEMTYRASFLIWALVHTLTLLINIIFFSIVYTNIPEINGWDYNKTLILLGTSQLLIGIGTATFFCFMYGFSGLIRTGDLDFLITKPLDIQFLSTIRAVDIEDLIIIPNSLLVLIIAVARIEIPNLLLNFIGYIILLISSLLILYAITLMIQSLAFKAVKITFAESLIWNIIQQGQYPVKIFQGPLRVIFMLVIPIGLITTVPAEVLMGVFDWKWIVTSLGLAISLFVISRKVFLLGLKGYSSASS